MAYILYKIPDAKKYTKFEIPKKSGGTREINAPVERLKTLQRHLANLLYACRVTIEHERPQRPLSHGFRTNYSIITNAKPHKNRRFGLNLDLKDFFPSLNFGRVRRFFLKNRDFELHEKVATVIAQIACHENALPQGSPCSPVIADMLAHLLDVRLARLSKAHGATYSRYADDLTFSTNQKNFPADLARRDNVAGSDWELGNVLVKTIENAGFAINAGKTRMQCWSGRQLVTGLTVNAKVNIRSEYYRSARAMCHSLFRAGSYHRRELVTAGDDKSSFELISKLNPLEGILSHIHHVKNTIDLREKQLKRKEPTVARKLYAQFLFYKYFIALPKALVICEGKTDRIYLKYALRYLNTFHPKLGSWTGEKFNNKISFFSYSRQANELIHLGGGAGDFAKLLGNYQGNLDAFAHKPLLHPVIVLIDNDDGAKPVFSVLNKNPKLKVDFKSDELFYHLLENLYVIKTPALGVDGTSCIENFFEAPLLAEKLKGKVFNFQTSIDSATQYGKAAFAEKVVAAKAGTINFSKFAPILALIAAVIEDYKPPVNAPPTPVAAESVGRTTTGGAQKKS